MGVAGFTAALGVGAITAAGPSTAETVVRGDGCSALAERVSRQREISQGYACGLAASDLARGHERDWRQGGTCDPATRQQWARLVERRAAALEICLIRRLAARDGGAREPGQPARQDAPTIGTGLAAQRAGIRPAGTRANGDDQATPAPLTGDGAAPDDAAARARSARRVRDLLARSPTPDTRDAATSTSVAREFRAGLAWSYGGVIAGMHCTKWEEPSDPHDWYDNYLCAARDLGFKWSFRGPIQGRGLKCIQINEPSDPHFWHDNYFCWPRDLRVSFRFSSAGRLPGLDCIAIVEPSDPHTWRDNFLCYREE